MSSRTHQSNLKSTLDRNFKIHIYKSKDVVSTHGKKLATITLMGVTSIENLGEYPPLRMPLNVIETNPIMKKSFTKIEERRQS